MPIALVTGATGGMGLEIVRELSRDHRVIALGRNGDKLAALGTMRDVLPAGIDMSDTSGLAAIVTALPRLDVLVHAAAIAERHSIEAASIDDWMRHLQLNVVIPAELTRLALPALLSSRGIVVFINSGAGARAIGGHAVYSASKFALRAIADALRLEEASHRVRVSTVSPGPTDTEMLRADLLRSGSPYEPARYIDPVSVARAVRSVVDATADVQLTDVTVRPRVEA